MKKILQWLSENILFLSTLFLLVFIPLYPKLPLINVVHTWVYIRAEDFFVVAVSLIWAVLLFRKKITLKTPLTMPILLFWLAGALATIHGILIIFPDIANVFPNVAFLSFLRRIEYIFLFFVAYSAVKDKKGVIPYIVAIITITLFGVFFYGVGEKYFSFPAYLTMNEQYAKGIPIILSPLSRVPSTFAGHYDLAAYLVLVLPLLASLLFGIRNLFTRAAILFTFVCGLVLLFWTVSRVSFAVLFVSILVVLVLQKKKWILVSLPVIGVIIAFLLLTLSPRILNRFGNTVKPIDVLVNAQTGEALGNVQTITKDDIHGKVVMKTNFISKESLDSINKPEFQASRSAVPLELVPLPGVLLVPPNASTGENLPQGTGYQDLLLSPIVQQTNQFFYIQKQDQATHSSEIQMLVGQFLIKRANAYDLSLTTRYQGEWPNAIAAFKRNILFGSGYGSISLAIDNSYLRMLGEVGSLGFLTFFLIFIIAGMYIKKVLPQVESPLVRSFVIGFVAGGIGIILNATLIDVFEASKDAYYLWMLMGITIGVLHAYQTQRFDFYQTLKKIAVSPVAIIIYLGLVSLVTFVPMLGNFFVGDDFTWFRWAATAHNNFAQLVQYFTQADGFFYRPGTKIYFQAMYSLFWLNPLAYHVVSLAAHVIVGSLVFLTVRKIFRNYGLAVLSAFLFVFLSGYTEAVFWISSVGHVFSAMFILVSIYLFLFWLEKRNVIIYMLSLISILFALSFHELAVIAPLLLMLVAFTVTNWSFKEFKTYKKYYVSLFSPLVLYTIFRVISGSHWTGGDYSYSIINLPFNIIGNTIGYSLLSFFGPISLSFYEKLRSVANTHIPLTIVATLILIAACYGLYRVLRSYLKKIAWEDRNVLIFGAAFAFIAMIPFLDFGNITSRYTYLPSLGFVVLAAFGINKLYNYLLINGRDIALGIVATILSTFLLFNIMQVQQMSGDWHDAGLKASNFLTSFQGIYLDYWSKEPMTFNLVNVPIRNGQAWVFPVGINDALWIITKNPQVTINEWSSTDQALSMIKNPVNEKVFLFDSLGNITEQRIIRRHQ